jgi:hypothetical protein
MSDTLQIPSGHIVMTTHGMVRAETLGCWTEMRSYSEKQGLTNARWYTMPGTLVAKARNDAVRSLLADPNAQWLLQIDADMTFAPDALLKILTTAYAELPHADAVGAYCPLRGDMAIPTIDSGSGTWESFFPGSGTVEVMRTGAAFILTKRHVYENLNQPWYALRVPMRPIDAMAEIDNWCRIKFDGENPFRNLPSEAWEKLERCAIDDPSCSQDQFTPNECGEDSGFCDRMRMAGFRIFVNTDVPTGHVDTRIIDWTTHKKAMQDQEKHIRLGAGLLA